MVNPITTAKIFSTLGSNTSLVPLGIKDISNTVGLTTGAYVTGDKIEGKDRFIDEFGTQVIWLLGIPFFKKVIDKTVYSLAKFNPNIDTRILKNKEIFQKAKEHAIPSLKAGFERIEQKQKMFKGLAVAKFIASTGLTMASYSILTTFRHKNTEKAIIKQVQQEETTKKASEKFIEEKKPLAFKAFNKNKQKAQTPSFGMSLDPLRQFMFNPVKNTMIIDGGITTERLADARNPQDFTGYVIKEGGFWAFMYFAGPAVQKYFEKRAAKGGKPIDLDISVLQDEKLHAAIKDKSIEKDFAEFSTKGTDAEIYESLFNKGDNFVVKMAKKSGLIKTVKSTEQIDTQHFINIDDIKGIKTKLENLYHKAPQSTEEATDFFKHIVKLKRASIIKNMAVSIGALGVLIPGIMVAMRLTGKDNKEFQVKKEIQEKMLANN